MLLKSPVIIKQEELVSILEAQLKKAKTRLSELSKADTKIKSVVAELESLLSEHPDYKLLVSDRLKLGESEADQTGPVRIEIKQELDQLDTLTEKLDSASEYKLKFGRIGNTVAVGYGNKMIGKYGLSDSQIWRDTFLSDYLIKEHGIQFDDLLSELNSETTPQDVVEAYDSLFGEAPPQNTPHTEKIDKIESPYSSEAEVAKVNAAQPTISEKNVGDTEQSLVVNETTAVEPESNFQNPDPTPTPTELKQQLLSKATRAELDAFKANIGSAKVKEIWELCSIPERNQIKCISKAKVAKRVPATLGYKFQYTAPITKAKYEAIYLGYYLHGQPVEKDNERVIFVEGRAIICTKDDLRPCREQPGISEDERARLEVIISEESEQPTAEEIASNTFTGLAPSPKQEILGGRAETITDAEIAANASQMKATTGSQAGNKQEEQVLEQSVGVQTELYLKVEQPEPSKKTEVIPTPLLETVAGEIKKVNPELTFGYDSNGKSTFLDVYHGTSYIGIFEDDGVDLYSSNTSKMLHHGFTEEMIDALIEIELSPKV
ncbi:MAG: hypothetical protein F6K23_38870 [Okeania sp. SIO2C9]|uniref:hypothetical protein n=1 Tax=Okeania sp. SIO2C9 TaxID=2607791 RepID=UPI0013C287D7|nr:hypothetical protein [Okeania sp. SIO2C9]NEQ78435.1 hypothetical protein [Okeania sp. SIO2C9]